MEYNDTHWGEENGLKSDYINGCTTLNIVKITDFYTLNGHTVCYIISVNPLKKECTINNITHTNIMWKQRKPDTKQYILYDSFNKKCRRWQNKLMVTENSYCSNEQLAGTEQK